MDKSIENIWKNGNAKKQFRIPNIEKLYNQKSISYVEKMIIEFKSEVYILIPATVLSFLFSIWLGNDNAIYWGIIASFPGLVWFFIGKSQLKSLIKLDYQLSSYDYLVAVKTKLISIRKFNRNLIVSSSPILLFLLLIYTYYKQVGKTIGEILGVDGLNYPTISLFLLLPIFTLLLAIVAQIHFKTVNRKTTTKISKLIGEIEELRK
ncbi:hypothetical protein [Algoriphagus aquimarinus]|uniref:hypothetical protein n=1 Tax=Algoriphagus aquimarinus TaxID=237018 RepID=UPI0030DB16DF|tara:strand:+ start:4321 stop:4941 length:621 start_codon:yes stop_codon:yes gene_type:complete